MNFNWEKLTYKPKYEDVLAIEYSGYNYSEIMQFAGTESSKDNWDEPNYIRDDYRKIYFNQAGLRCFVKFRTTDVVLKFKNGYMTSLPKETFNLLFK